MTPRRPFNVCLSWTDGLSISVYDNKRHQVQATRFLLLLGLFFLLPTTTPPPIIQNVRRL